MMQIHFVSYGHAFRSRLAEAYMRHLLRKYKNIKITSSGIIIENDLNGPIAWYAMKILAQHALTPYMSLEPVKTTKGMLEDADLVIFMDSHSFEFCQKKFNYKSNPHEVWELGYIHPDKVERGSDLKKDIEIMEHSEEIFAQIKTNCRRIYNDFSITEVPFEK